MRYYLAARYGRKSELIGVKAAICAYGGEVSSSWLHDDTEEKPDSPVDGVEEEAEMLAHLDLADVDSADVLVLFSELPNSPFARGGRHVEFGFAIARRKRLIVIGPKENLFHFLPQVEVYPDVEAWFTVEFAKQGKAGVS